MCRRQATNKTMLSKAWATLARKMQAKYKKLTNFFYFRVFPGEKPIRFFLFWGDGRVPYNADNTAGFLMYHRSNSRLDALPNTTTDLGFEPSPTPLSSRPRPLPPAGEICLCKSEKATEDHNATRSLANQISAKCELETIQFNYGN